MALAALAEEVEASGEVESEMEIEIGIGTEIEIVTGEETEVETVIGIEVETETEIEIVGKETAGASLEVARGTAGGDVAPGATHDPQTLVAPTHDPDRGTPDQDPNPAAAGARRPPETSPSATHP